MIGVGEEELEGEGGGKVHVSLPANSLSIKELHTCELHVSHIFVVFFQHMKRVRES